MKYAFILLLLTISISAQAVVSVTANTPTYNFQVLAGSVRTVSVNITGGTGNLINWTVSATTGGASATLSASTNALPEVTVTIGATAGTCSISGSIGAYSVSSTATVTVQAQSVDDVTKTATILFNVCANMTAVTIVPFYRTLYVNQKADLQSFIVDNANLNVTWSLGSCTGTAVGSLSDTSNRDTVFSATGAGRCTITATSVADNTKSATTTMYVTGNALPSYLVTPNKTQPIDCTVDPALTGATYEVGPARTYTTISAAMNAAFAIAAAGSTIRVHNDDLTGNSPTTYHEYVQLGYNESNGANNGTATQPIRFVGCPDSLGNLPIMDGANATGSSWVSTGAAAGFGVITLWPGPPTPFGLYTGSNNASPQYIIVEGVHVKNARPANSYTTPGGGGISAISRTSNVVTATTTANPNGFTNGSIVVVTNVAGGATSFNGTFTLTGRTATTITWAQTGGDESGTTSGSSLVVQEYVDGASCINVRASFYAVVDGNDLDNCANGTFSDFNGAHAWLGGVLWTDWEGNHIHNSGVVGDFLDHQLYIQGYGEVAQFNIIDSYTSGANGSNIKSRGIFDTIRYNYIGDNAARQMDLIDIQDAPAYENFEQYLGPTGTSNCNLSSWCLGDTMGANVLAGWQEAFHWHFVYGNISNSSTSGDTLHFSEDHDGGMADRLGTLYFYNNTWQLTGPAAFGGVSALAVLFDTSGGGGNAFNNFEWQNVQAENNIYWTDSSGKPYWNLLATFIGTFTTNLLNTNWGSISTPINGGVVNSETGNGWSNTTTAFSYLLAVPLDSHMSGISSGNFLTTGTQPFDSTTYVPPLNSAAIDAGMALSGAMTAMPVRFQIRPDTGVVTVRSQPLTIGALDGLSSGQEGAPRGLLP